MYSLSGDFPSPGDSLACLLGVLLGRQLAQPRSDVLVRLPNDAVHLILRGEGGDGGDEVDQGPD